MPFGYGGPTISIKLNSACYVLKILSNCIDFNTLRKVYFPKFQSILTYGLTVWGGTSIDNFNRLFVIQKRAMRIIHCVPPDDHCKPLFKNYKAMTLACLYILSFVSISLKTEIYLSTQIQLTTQDIIL